MTIELSSPLPISDVATQILQQFQPDEIIYRETLEELLGFNPASDSPGVFGLRIAALHRELLEKHQRMLQNLRPQQWRIVPPNQHVDVAEELGDSMIASALNWKKRGVINVDRKVLSADEQAHADEVQARCAHREALMQRAFRALPGSKK